MSLNALSPTKTEGNGINVPKALWRIYYISFGFCKRRYDFCVWPSALAWFGGVAYYLLLLFCIYYLLYLIHHVLFIIYHLLTYYYVLLILYYMLLADYSLSAVYYIFTIDYYSM